jgi:hypothetical protein
VTRTPVPEATVDEDRDFRANEGQIGTAPHPWQGAIDAKTESPHMQCRAERELAGRIAPRRSPHASADRVGRSLRPARRRAAGPRQVGHRRPT